MGCLKGCLGYFMILGAIPGFFLSSFFVMLFWGIISPWFGVATIGYLNAMLVTIVIWLVIAPLVAVKRK